MLKLAFVSTVNQERNHVVQKATQGPNILATPPSYGFLPSVLNSSMRRLIKVRWSVSALRRLPLLLARFLIEIDGLPCGRDLHHGQGIPFADVLVS